MQETPTVEKPKTESKQGIKKVEEPRFMVSEIEIKSSPRFVTLPPELQDESVTKIGSYSLPGEAYGHMPLSFAQMKEFSNDVLGISSDSPSFQKAAENFFDDYTVVLRGSEKRTLRVPMDEKGEVVINEETRGYIGDIIAYLFCKDHPRVAFGNKEDVDSGLHLALMYDKSESKKQRLLLSKKSREADVKYVNLTGKNRDEDIIDAVIIMLRDGVTSKTGDMVSFESLDSVTNFYDLETDEKDVILQDFKNKYPLEFVEIIEDDSIKQKGFISSLLMAGIVTKSGNTYFYGDEKMGDKKAFISRLKSPTEGGFVSKLESQLNTASSQTF